MIIKGVFTVGAVMFLNSFLFKNMTFRSEKSFFHLSQLFCYALRHVSVEKACLSVSGDKIMKAALSTAASAV